jgi:hypothetical protein
MPHDADVRQALLRAKGLTPAELATRLGTTLPEAQALLAREDNGRTRADDVDRLLALGPDRPGSPPYALAVLSADGEIDLLPAGDTQPLFAERGLAMEFAEELADAADVFVVPVWPEYAWRKLVAFHAAWGSDPQPRSVFLADELDPDVSIDVVLAELEAGFRETLRLRAAADDPDRLREVEARFAALTELVPTAARPPQAAERSAEPGPRSAVPPRTHVVDRLGAWLERADDRLN